MKKILIGCGVLVLLVLVGFGVMAWMLKDEFMAMTTEMAQQAQRMTSLEETAPFTEPSSPDEFDGDRFLASLSARETLLGNLESIGQNFEELENQDLGFMETMKKGMAAGVEASTGVYAGIAEGLETADMGPSEFIYHTKVLWASLKSVDAGLGPEALAPYRNVFTLANNETAQQFRFQPGTPDSLEVFADGVPPAIVEKAVGVLGENVATLQQALPADQATDLAQAIDVLVTTLPKWLDDMKPAVEALEQGQLPVSK